MFEAPIAERAGWPPGPAAVLPFEAAADVAVAVLQEDIQHGERARRYELQLREDGRWRTIADGSCIGHKRIHRFEPAVRGDALRLRITDSSGTPALRRIAAYPPAR